MILFKKLNHIYLAFIRTHWGGRYDFRSLMKENTNFSISENSLYLSNHGTVI